MRRVQGTRWASWYVRMWVLIFIGLIAAVFFIPFYWWMGAVVIAFGVPEFIGTVHQDDAYPPLTHVIVRYVNREYSFPFFYGFTTTAGAYWLHVTQPWRFGLLFGLIGWLNAHFDSRYEEQGR